MGLPAEKTVFTRDDYIAWESEQQDRHEFINGGVFAMTGMRDSHNVIAGDFYLALRQHLKGSTCRTYMADVKLEVVAVDSIFYPDVFFTCEFPSDPLINSDEPQLDIYRRAEGDASLIRSFRTGESFTLDSIGLPLSVDAIFDDVDFNAA